MNVPRVPSATPETEHFWIAEGVHVCLVNEGAIFLDINRNKYFGVSASEVAALRISVIDWPTNSRDGFSNAPSSSRTEALETCRKLEQAGLLQAEKPRRLVSYSEEPELDCPLIAVGRHTSADLSLRVNDVFDVFNAYSKAWRNLKFRAFRSVVRALQESKLNGMRNVRPPAPDALIEKVSLFSAARPYVFTANGRCLLHALTLIYFLQRYDIYPNLVIGVRTRPWGAHSWVQYQNMILDSDPEKVWDFTPILAI